MERPWDPDLVVARYVGADADGTTEYDDEDCRCAFTIRPTPDGAWALHYSYTRRDGIHWVELEDYRATKPWPILYRLEEMALHWMKDDCPSFGHVFTVTVLEGPCGGVYTNRPVHTCGPEPSQLHLHVCFHGVWEYLRFAGYALVRAPIEEPPVEDAHGYRIRRHTQPMGHYDHLHEAAREGRLIPYKPGRDATIIPRLEDLDATPLPKADRAGQFSLF